MNECLGFKDLTYERISSYIEDAVNQDAISPLYLLGKAAAYVDISFSLARITESEARQLHDCIAVHAACNTD